MRIGYGGAIPRDYGATSSSAATTMPEVDFAGGFSPTEFISLSENIAANVSSIKSSFQQLEKFNRVIGTDRDKKNVRDQV
jgi:t-SNARE domain-containing protein 1